MDRLTIAALVLALGSGPLTGCSRDITAGPLVISESNLASYRASAKAGDVEANRILNDYLIHVSGGVMTPEIEEALQRGVGQGSPDAMVTYGIQLQSTGRPEDCAKAYGLFAQSVVAGEKAGLSRGWLDNSIHMRDSTELADCARGTAPGP